MRNTSTEILDLSSGIKNNLVLDLNFLVNEYEQPLDFEIVAKDKYRSFTPPVVIPVAQGDKVKTGLQYSMTYISTIICMFRLTASSNVHFTYSCNIPR